MWPLSQTTHFSSLFFYSVHTEEGLVDLCLSIWRLAWHIFSTSYLPLRDLRGNSFRCDCKIKWLVDWMEKTNTSVPTIYCASPFEFQGRRIHDLAPRDFNCISAGFTLSLVLFWTLCNTQCHSVTSCLPSYRFCCLWNVPFPLRVSGVLRIQWRPVCCVCSAWFRVLHLVCMGPCGDGLQEVSQHYL